MKFLYVRRDLKECCSQPQFLVLAENWKQSECPRKVIGWIDVDELYKGTLWKHGCTAATAIDMHESHKQSIEQKKQVPKDFCLCTLNVSIQYDAICIKFRKKAKLNGMHTEMVKLRKAKELSS